MGLSFLIADSDVAFRQRLCAALRVHGHRAEEARDGAAALRQLRGSQPDVVLTEMLMPEADGFEVIAAVKALHRPPVVIAMSGNSNLAGLDLLLLASRLGADATLEKPFDADRLMETVKAALAAQTD